MNDALSVFRFLRDRAWCGEPAALVTLVGIVGSSARSLGAHMGVSESGSFAGSLSGGCVEAAIVAEAQRVLEDGRTRRVRFGEGSPYRDIVLPCGGGIDLLFHPAPATSAVDRARVLLEARKPAVITWSEDEPLHVSHAIDPVATGWSHRRFTVRHAPPLRLVVAGHGAEPGALMRLASTYGAEAELLSPDAALVTGTRHLGFRAELLSRRGAVPTFALDRWSAVVSLFHDHTWETRVLAHALDSDAFFVGAMGSRATHQRRCVHLVEAGVSAPNVARIVGPVGVIPGARDPATLAVSVLAQVVQAYEAQFNASQG